MKVARDNVANILFGIVVLLVIGLFIGLVYMDQEVWEPGQREKAIERIEESCGTEKAEDYQVAYPDADGNDSERSEEIVNSCLDLGVEED